MLSSDAIDAEISFTLDEERRKKVTALAVLALNNVAVDDKIKSRAQEILGMGFKPFDSLHLA